MQEPVDSVSAASSERDDVLSTIRNGLKHQVKGIRDLQSTLDQGLEQLMSRLDRWNETAKQHDSEPRRMVRSLAEVDEGLQRSLSGMRSQLESLPEENATVAGQGVFDSLKALPSWKRWLIGPILEQIKSVIDERDAQSQRIRSAVLNSHQGLELLYNRVQRLMQQHGLERIDVLGRPFDPERMHAIEVISSTDVPSSHVAEQLRPAYLWNQHLLIVAEVRLAR
jgi:hypothetical protein